MTRSVSLWLLLTGMPYLSPAQDSNTVHVFSRYHLTCDKINLSNGPFFIARQPDPLTPEEKEKIILSNTCRIRDEVKQGIPQREYHWSFGVRTGWPEYLSIEYTDKLTARDLHPSPLQNVESFERLKGANSALFTRLKNGETACTHCSLDTGGRIIILTDTVLQEDPKRKKYIGKPVHIYLDPADASLFFGEEWHFDFVNGRFEKNVTHLGISKPLCHDEQTKCFPVQLLCMENKTSGAPGNWTLLRKDCVTDVAVNYAQASLSVIYGSEKADVYDALGQLSIADGSIPEVYRYPFLSALLGYALKNPGAVFAQDSLGNIDSTRAYKNRQQVLDHFIVRQDIQVEDPAHPGSLQLVQIKSERGLMSIYALRFYENWYLNTSTGALRKTVHGISLLMNEADPNTGDPLLRHAGIYIRMK